MTFIMHATRPNTLLLLAVTMLVGCGGNGPGDSGAKDGAPPTTDDGKAIHAAFSAYHQAVFTGDGQAASELIDDDSIAYYQRVRDLAFDASADETKALDVSDKLTVLLIRARVSAADLQALDGRGLFVMMVEQGWVAKQSAENVDLADIVVDGDAATGRMVINRETTPLEMKFTRTGADWKLNLPHIAAIGQRALKKQIESNGQPENEFVINNVATVVGRSLRPSIWEPRNLDKRLVFDVVLTNAGDRKLQLVEAIRKATNYPLTDARSLADNTPSVIKQSIPRDEADALIAALEAEGGQAELQ